MTAKSDKAAGQVALVGAGPGDPDLLTVKALRLIQAAEVVVYDRLVSKEIMDLIPPQTERVYAGKALGHHHLVQDEINDLLLRLARSGRNVVRLKGGDSFVFGRGSEEALHLARNGVSFEVVPGISAAAGCSSYAGIPLTHRGLATGVQFVPGHLREGRNLDLNWDKLADPQTTLVIYMGLQSLPETSAELIKAGLPADTPACAIENGTTPRQRRVIGTLSNLPGRARDAGLQAPTLIVIGKVVSLAVDLDWFNLDGGSQ
ncbi:uroporphyrinogen-III C-methyltransferase [Paramagnetospirillum kuznetsovii]|uniref:uroporphyrinogen-III C-methyltransferase n=1 Tax=Paramagnetospirillum kuznetsovii TaxID=2053833 RepID=A0A364P2S2_9PROT|nr:uroporphyrinogen-III C-methyltransferase [Paramagnetospirillum kuznetsovii]RAU23385.1 uroporphyrinogen-III C-methyltransferase [Paramagnetospirillum kuznetsovii]